MERMQLIAFARRLSTVLGHRRCWLTHSQSLDLVAGTMGASSWYQLGSIPRSPSDIGSNELDLARLVRRIAQITGVHIERSTLSAALSSALTSTQPILLEEASTAGIYVTTSWDAANAAVARYMIDTGGADCYADNDRMRSANVVSLGPSHPGSERTGIFAPRLHRAPKGTLIVLGPLNLTQFDWESAAEKLHEACRLVLERGHRIISVVQTPREGVFRSDLVLTLSSGDYDIAYLERAFRGAVSDDGQCVDVVPFRERRPAPSSSTLPRVSRQLPRELASLLEVGLGLRRRGFLVVGGGCLSVERELLFTAALEVTENFGPVALVFSSYDREVEENLEAVSTDTSQRLLRSQRFPFLPLFPSIESAYASGYRRIACWGDFGQCDLSPYAQDVCFVIGIESVEATEAFSVGTGAGQHASRWGILDGVIAVLCWGNLYGEKGTFSVYDAFVPSAAPIKRHRYEAVWDAVRAHRELQWEQQVNDLLAAGQVTSEDVRGYLLESELIPCDEDNEWDRVSTARGLRAWLSKRTKAGPSERGN
jgi:hypothetical protein